MAGTLGFAVGDRKVGDVTEQTTTSNVGSLLISTGGNVSVTAGKNINVQGSVVESGKGDVTLTAPTVTVSAGISTYTFSATHTADFAGLNVSVEPGGGNPLGQGSGRQTTWRPRKSHKAVL